jgi:hypothetical protein
MTLDAQIHTVIPVLVPGIQPLASACVRSTMDPDNKRRDDDLR